MVHRTKLVLTGFLSLLFISTCTFSQKASGSSHVMWGIPNPKKSESFQSVILYTAKDSLIVFRTEKKNNREAQAVVLELYNTLNFRIDKTFRLPIDAYKNDVVRVVHSDVRQGQVRVFISRQRKGERNVKLMVHTFSLGFDELINGIELISFYIPPPCSVYDWDIISSVAGNIFIAHPYGSEKRTEGLRFFTIDQHLVKKKYKDFALAAKSGSIEQVQIHAAPAEFALASARIMLDDAPEKFMIFLAGNNFSDALEFSLGQGKRILEISARENLAGFSLSGLYSQDKKRNRCAGIFTGMYSLQNKSVVQLNYFILSDLKEKNNAFVSQSEFPEDLFIKRYYGIGEYDMMICEQIRDENICISDPRTGFMRCNDYFHRNHILVFAIKNGQVLWKFTYPKRQTSVDDYGIYLSFCSFAGANELSLLFNENKKNLPVSKERTMENVYKAECVLLTLYPDGRYLSESLFSNRDTELILRPELHATLPNGEWILYAEKGKGYKFGKLNRYATFETH